MARRLRTTRVSAMFVAWCLVPTSISSSAVLGTTSWNAENQASCRHPNYDRHQLVSGIYLWGKYE